MALTIVTRLADAGYVLTPGVWERGIDAVGRITRSLLMR